ncbi:MAG TPA: DUF1640 domain-containing protein [Deltaproteobacteria bacterium]|nr:DUF1640 domain-containing protein [Deltaproteobacteria bacterium]
MATITFDTLKFVKKLKAAGFGEDQAEALSEAFKESQETTIADLATKSDLKELEMRLTIRVGAMMAAAIAIITAMVKLL